MPDRSPSQSVIRAARAVEKARQKIDSKTGAAPNAVWNEIERKENRLLRAVEKLSGIAHGALGSRDSE